MRNISGTITLGGTAQTLFDPQGMPYKGWWLRNNSTSVSVWINENGTAAAAQPSIEIKVGELYESPPNINMMMDTLSIFCGTTSVSFTARVW